MAELPKRNDDADTPLNEDELLAALAEQMADPLLTRLYALAKQYAREINNNQLDQAAQKALERRLDAEWPYMDEKITVSGLVKAIYDNGGMLEIRPQFEMSCISNGFAFVRDQLYADGEVVLGDVKAGLYITFDDTNARVQRRGFVDVDHINHTELPFPSSEYREQRFAYHHPLAAEHIDELVFTAPRGDMVLRDLGEFYFDANLDDEDDLEHVRDGAEYIRRKTSFEREVNYVIAFSGDYILVDDDGHGSILRAEKPYVAAMCVRDIALRPAGLTVETLTGIHRCVPFIDATAFDVDGQNYHLLFPCSSILWVNSVRYSPLKPPQI